MSKQHDILMYPPAFPRFVTACLLASTGLAAAASANEATSCTGWHIGEHKLASEAEARCWEALKANGGLASVDEGTLSKEADHFYQDVANTGNPWDAAILRLLVNEQERRTPPRGQHDSSIYSALLLSGQLDEARAERAEKALTYPPLKFQMHPRPRSSAQDAAYWSPSPTNTDLFEGYVNLSEGSHIVVYSTPDCGPCSMAAAALSKNRAWREIFQRNSIWVETPDVNFDIGNYAKWQSTYPMFPIHVLFDRRNWPQRDIPGTPYFFFIKDGRVVSKMIGWTPQTKASLPERLRALGLS